MKTKTERETKGKRKNPIATKPLPAVEHAPHPCISIEMVIGFISHHPWPHAPS
jgi:hypothetical protein